jgi:hypothetical protein
MFNLLCHRDMVSTSPSSPARPLVQSSNPGKRTNTVQDNSITPCRFKASEMLELRRAIASNPTLTIPQIGLIIGIIDQARHEHFEATNCACWQAAIEALDCNARLPFSVYA